MAGFAAVFRALVGSYIRHESGRTALTVLGVALGVAVLVAIDLAADSSLRSFRKTVEDVAGRATLTVFSPGGGVDPALAARLLEHPDVVDAQPLIQGAASFPDGDGAIALTLLGVDLLAAGDPAFDASQAVRDLRFEAAEGFDFLELLSGTDRAVFGEGFAREAGIRPGDAIELSLGGRPHGMRVAGIANAGDFAGAFGGRFLVVDLGVADLLLGRGGLVDRFDLVTAPDADIERVAAELRADLGSDLLVERPERRSARVDEMLAAFRFNLRALGHISLLVGAFLIYNTLSIAVARRRTAIGALRAMGVRRGAVRAAILAEGLLIGAVGGVLGLAGGVLLAWAMLGRVADAISMNFVAIGAASLFPSPGLLAGAFGLGVVLSAAAAWGPAREASATAPANTMRRGSGEGAGLPNGARLAIAAMLAMGGLLFLAQEPRSGIPWIGYGASTLFLAAFAASIRPAMAGATALLRAPMARAFGPEGLLAVAAARASLSRAGVAISGLMVSVGMAVAVTVMVASFRGTVIDWMDGVLVADIYVSSASTDPAEPFLPMPADFAEEVLAIPGIRQVDAFRGRRILFEDQHTWVAGAPFRLERFRATLVGDRPAEEVVAEAEAGGAAIVSESFARKHRRAAGDTIDLPTPGGSVPIRIAGVYRDYSSEQGLVILSRARFVELYGDDRLDSLTIWLDQGAEIEAARAAILAAASARGDVPPLAARADAELRRLALDQFDRTFGVTEVLKAIAVLVAILGVATTLLAQILDRRDELATLRTLGIARGRVARVVVLESGIIGAGGIALGIAAGLMLSWILTKVVMLESFGWTIAYSVPPWPVAQTALLVLAATLAAGLLPAREAARSASLRPGTTAG